jgi:DNA-binding PadR family transcriptional regulator
MQPQHKKSRSGIALLKADLQNLDIKKLLDKAISKGYSLVTVYLLDIEVQKMSKDNQTLYAILGLLNHEDMTGYDIKKRFEYSLKYFWNAGYGQIYPGLKTLQKSGWVTSVMSPSSAGPDRITYSITDLGKERLIVWLSQPAEKEQAKFEILLKLFFSGAVDPTVSLHNIREFRDRNVATQQLFSAYEKQLAQIRSVSIDHTYYYLTVLFGQKIEKAYLDWADEAEDILKQLEKDK